MLGVLKSTCVLHTGTLTVALIRTLITNSAMPGCKTCGHCKWYFVTHLAIVKIDQTSHGGNAIANIVVIIACINKIMHKQNACIVYIHTEVCVCVCVWCVYICGNRKD